MSVGVSNRAFFRVRRILAAILATPGPRGDGDDFALGSQLRLDDELRSARSPHLTVAPPLERTDGSLIGRSCISLCWLFYGTWFDQPFHSRARDKSFLVSRTTGPDRPLR